MEKLKNEISKEQTIILKNKQFLTVGGTNKIISLKTDLIQLDTIYGGLIINGNDLELIKLDNETMNAEIKGNVNSLKFVESKNKEPIFRKIFK
ncbi:MAG: hypothetical protein E7374_00420 [Clostridiales bacterium]|nr:hypothetical protein [Clostridiales bacterium]